MYACQDDVAYIIAQKATQSRTNQNTRQRKGDGVMQDPSVEWKMKTVDEQNGDVRPIVSSLADTHYKLAFKVLKRLNEIQVGKANEWQNT